MYSIRRSRVLVGYLGFLGAAGCAGATAESASGAAAQLMSAKSDEAQSDPATETDESAASIDEVEAEGAIEQLDEPLPLEAGSLDCSTGQGVHAAFGCDSVLTSSCKDLSNVVLEFEDGERQRFEGLTGYSSAFAGTDQNAGKVILRVWIKSGDNHSGEGPGYGTRFDAPETNCAEDAEGSPEPEVVAEPEPTSEPDSDAEQCGLLPDEYCSEPTPPPGTCDPEDPASECYFPAPE